jgi:hypothetical protein
MNVRHLITTSSSARNWCDAKTESLPFSPGDATAGTENELQAVVIGKRTAVDLPVTIERSKYFANIARRVASGETSQQLIKELERFLSNNQENVWDNSWVRFPRKYLSEFAGQVLEEDLVRGNESWCEPRADWNKFVFSTSLGEWIRIPISYLVKLSLCDVIGRQPNLPADLKETSLSLLPHFSNDQTSPETFSFHVIHSKRSFRFGNSIAGEMARRFLLTHLLVEWANKAIGLEAVGQRASVNCAPHPPVRQRELNNCVSDAFYRDLFVSPCLSGWSDGEAKHQYMVLAHQILSRSQINAVVKMREAGIITNNLVVLPNTSTVSLANNGTHLSLGSKKIGSLLNQPNAGFSKHDAKRIGDLVIKVSEHFLPLFVGTFTAAPYRLGFSDLHPEKALGFLPHELDYTHLRMLWRHWKRKAHLRVLGRSITPYGPQVLDCALSTAFGLRGDLVPDYRLIDFPVAWLCTESASALDGELGNTVRLKSDLENMGVSDRNLKLYLPISLREFEVMRFFGFEARHYSLFESMVDDFAPAADLQQLITLLAYKYVVSGVYSHQHIPNDPYSESERRLPFFCAALGLEAFNLRMDTPNDFLRRLATRLRKSIASRHRGYLRIDLREYCEALVDILEQDASDCIELLGVRSTLAELRSRLKSLELQAYGKLTSGIMTKLGRSNPLKVEAREFNLAAERFYREELKRRHIKEGLAFTRNSIAALPAERGQDINEIIGELDPRHFLNQIEEAVINDRLKPLQLQALINLVLLAIKWESDNSDGSRPRVAKNVQASIHRSQHTATA